MSDSSKHLNNLRITKTSREIAQEKNRGFPRDLVLLNLNENISELEKILDGFDKKRIGNFIKSVLKGSGILDFLFVSAKHAPSKIERKSKYSNLQLRQHVKSGINQAEKFLIFLQEFERFIQNSTIEEFENRKKQYSSTEFYKENPTWLEHRIRLKSHLIEEVIYLKNVIDDLSNEKLNNPPTRRETNKTIFLIIGALILRELEISPTSTFNPSNNSYGIYVKILMWIYRIHESSFPQGAENLLKESVQELDKNKSVDEIISLYFRVFSKNYGLIPAQVSHPERETKRF